MLSKYHQFFLEISTCYVVSVDAYLSFSLSFGALFIFYLLILHVYGWPLFHNDKQHSMLQKGNRIESQYFVKFFIYHFYERKKQNLLIERTKQQEFQLSFCSESICDRIIRMFVWIIREEVTMLFRVTVKFILTWISAVFTLVRV